MNEQEILDEKKIMLFPFFIFAQIFLNTADATIYIAYSDPVTGGKSLAVITSGPIASNEHIIKAEKNLVMIGWGGGGSNIGIHYDSIMEGSRSGMTAKQLEESIQSDGYFRIVFIQGSGLIGSILPPKGCQRSHPWEECGRIIEDNFTIIGGGLWPGVLEKTKTEFMTISASNMEVPCKMLFGLKAIIQSGGENAFFQTGVIVADLPHYRELIWAGSTILDRTTSENDILLNLQQRLALQGHNCPL